MRTHNCGELRKLDVKKDVKLYGWNQTRRDHGGIIFIDLRDRYGLTQVVFDPKHSKEAHSTAESFSREDVIYVEGKVRERSQGMANPNLATGDIEVLADKVRLINKAETPPIEVDDRKEANEEIRLKYRYLDLRRPCMQKRLLMRHKVISAARDYFNNHGFIEIQTPLLVKSTPEGARDYVVPSRVNPGKFYALPQSPQLYKQILMIAGCDRYYQVATCLRDEDLRADRQPEHTQFDLEMSFVSSDDVRDFVEGLYKHLSQEVLHRKLKEFDVLTYKDSMAKYSTDKPDTRFELFTFDVTDIVAKSDFKVFKEVAEKKGMVKCINPEKDLGRNEIDGYIRHCQEELGASGMAWMRFTENGLESNIAKYFPENVKRELTERVKPKKGSIIMFIADRPKRCNEIIGRLRLKLGKDLKLYDENDFSYAWVKDFPLFAWNEDEQRWEPEHHMFSMPKEEFVNDFEKRPADVIGDLWDLVLNGTELGSGSIRVTNPKLQERIMNFIGLSKEDANMKFGFLLEAYKYGAPVHGGMGIGVDRTVALMCGTNDIREVIAFPKNKAAECPMDSCPSEIDDLQMKELHIKTDAARPKEKNTVYGRIASLLNADNIKYRTMEHKAAYTSKEAAEARGTELRQGCKALICRTEKGFIQAIVPGDREIDLEKLRSLIGAKKAELANAEEVREVTGCNIGSVPPFGNLFGIEVYADAKVAENEIVAFNAGSHTTSIMMGSEDMIRAAKAKAGEFSK